MQKSSPQSSPSWLSSFSIRDRMLLIPGSIVIASLLVLFAGRQVLNKSLQDQLKEQTRSQLAVAKLNYDHDSQEIARSLYILAENPLVRQKVRDHASGKPLSATDQAQLQQMLRSMGRLDEAIIVGTNKLVLSSRKAVSSRGSTFDPNGLVSRVLQSKSRESSSEPWESSVNGEKTLIRYTATPIKAPNSQTVIGVIIGGIVVDDKVVKETLDAFGNQGYSAVYLHKSDGNFSLLTSQTIDQSRKEQENLELQDDYLLKKAVQAQGTTVFDRQPFENRTYTFAAKTIANYQGKPVGVLVYGDPEVELEKISQSLRWPLLSLLGLGLGGVGLSALIGYSITSPVRQLQGIMGRFAKGNYQERSTIRSQDEIGQLSDYFNNMADNILKNEEEIRQETEMFRFLAQLTTSSHLQSETLGEIWLKVAKEVKELLKVDRVVIYQFLPNGGGKVAYESVSSVWPSALNNSFDMACIPQSDLENYQNGQESQINDVATADLSSSHRQLLERLQIQADLVMPIKRQGDLFGLFIVHQCTAPRQWQETEVSFLRQMVNQLEVTLDRLELNEQRSLDAKLSLVLKDITLKIAATSGAEALFEAVLERSRQGLNCDRTIIYAFDESWRGTIVAESLNTAFPSALGAKIADPCFADKYVEQYRRGRVSATDDIDNAGLTDCHLDQLSPFNVKANLVTPINIGGELFGLLIAHHCQQPHTWQQPEIDFLTQVALQIGVALERAQLLEQKSIAQEEQRKAKEALQKRALDLIIEVDPVNQGDLTVHCSEQDDEIGTIARSYNTVVENLRHLVHQMQTTSGQLLVTTEQNGEVVQTLSVDAMRQLEDISRSLNALNSLRSAIETIAQNAQAALHVTEEARDAITMGEQEMEATMAEMHHIRETVTDTMTKIEHLDESSQKISKVVNLISRFAAQTHLLALKASIEAARAGEGGRGFAVIADEVRSLASQSAEATAEIETLVASIQAETKEVAATMESGTQQVWKGSKQVETSRHRMQNLVDASSRIQDLVAGITQATNEQSQDSQAVTGMMGEVTEIAQNTAELATSVAESFNELLIIANQLQDSVGQFKV
ncbi:MAG: methyl-accepting chemotaxis protein [Microcystaceae cyanobacterium]